MEPRWWRKKLCNAAEPRARNCRNRVSKGTGAEGEGEEGR